MLIEDTEKEAKANCMAGVCVIISNGVGKPIKPFLKKLASKKSKQ